jgi:hypothetical protein
VFILTRWREWVQKKFGLVGAELAAGVPFFRDKLLRFANRRTKEMKLPVEWFSTRRNTLKTRRQPARPCADIRTDINEYPSWRSGA